MPGVADQIRKTGLRQEQKARKSDKDDLLRMLKEGRIHEADERQLEMLSLALELKDLLNTKAPAPDTNDIASVIKDAITEGMSNIKVQPTTIYARETDDPNRPGMKHVSLAKLAQTGTEVDISHTEEIGKPVEGTDSAGKREKLKKLKKRR